MGWFDRNYKTNAVKSISEEVDNLLQGKCILTSPEGYGKSTDVLKHCLENPLGRPIIFTAHTIDNAREKYLYALEHWNIPDDVDMHLLNSNSELFRLMIRAQDELLYQFMKKSINFSNHKFLQYQMYSCNHGIVKPVGKSPSIIDKFNAWKMNPTPMSHNSISMADIYNSINSVHGRLNYYLIFKINDTANTTNPLPLNVNLQTLLEEHDYDIVAVRGALSKYGLSVVCITSESIKNWRGLRKQRDENLKELLIKPNVVILTQNKVTEEVIIPLLHKHDMDASLIVDEFTSDCYHVITQRDVDKLSTIIKKGFTYGFESLSQDEYFFITDLGIHDNVQEICESGVGSLSLGQVNLNVTPEGNSLVNIGEVKLAKRLTSCPNTLILTTEVVPSTILSKFYGYTISEIKKGYKFKDRKLKLYPTDKHTDVCVTKESKDTVVKYLDMFRETVNKKEETLAIGTSYFGVDITAEACKGRNFDDGIRKVCIVKNPEPFAKTAHLVSLIYQNDPTVDRKNLYEEVREYSLIDLLNQVIGRFSGERRKRYPNVSIDFLFYSRDKTLINAFKKLRYIGLFSKIKYKCLHLKSNYDTVNIHFAKVSRMINVYTDKDFIQHIYNNPLFSLQDIFKNSEYTRRGITYELVSKTLINDINNSYYLINNKIIGCTADESNSSSLPPLYEMDLLEFNQFTIPNPLLLLKYAFWSNYYGNNSYRFKRMLNNTNYLLTVIHKPCNLVSNKLINFFKLVYKNIPWYIAYILKETHTSTYNMLKTDNNTIQSFPYMDRGMRLLNQGIEDFAYKDKVGNKRLNDVLHFIKGISEKFNNPMNLIVTTNDNSLPNKLTHIQLPQAVECGFT